MKINYDRQEDILTVEIASGNIEHAQEMGSFIVHFDKNEKPILIEILDASDFLSMATKSSIKAQTVEVNS